MKSMADYIIKRTGEVDDERSGNLYTTFENPDKELKAKIAAFNPEITVYNDTFPPVDWEIVEWNKDDVKCVDGKNTHYFPRKQIEEFLVEERLRLLNQEFVAFKHFRETFGLLSAIRTFDDSDNFLELRKIDLNIGRDMGSLVGLKGTNFNPLGVEIYGTFDEYELNLETYAGDIELKVDRGMGCMMNFHFDANGDYVNRDYNEKLQNYVCGDISPDIIIEKIMERITSFEPYGEEDGQEFFLTSRDKYFSKQFCYNVYGNVVEVIPVMADGETYGKNRRGWSDKKYKLPKRITKTSREDFIKIIIENFKQILHGNIEETTSN